MEPIATKKRKKKTVLQEVRQIAIITLACAVYAAAITAFILPYDIVTGGIVGLANLIYYAARIPVAITYASINIALYALALWLLGWKYIARTVYASVALTTFLWVAQRLMTDPATGELVKILGDEKFMSMLLGCAIMGFSIATLFSCSGSSGGTDIVASIMNKYFNIPIGATLLTADLLIIASGLFIPTFGPMVERIRFVAFGVCAMSFECAVIAYALIIRRRSVQFLIFSEKYGELALEISLATGHTMTLLDGHGWYSGDEMKVICVLAKMSESSEIFRIIKEVDPKAFVSQSRVIGVFGEGFDAIRMIGERAEEKPKD
ncbi:MAG: YitT family protein [Kiritimatiellae bacterium]|nr:YitT family protein [Kiritimatiellia bacterium]